MSERLNKRAKDGMNMLQVGIEETLQENRRLREENGRLQKLASAFYKIGADIARCGCCNEPYREPCLPEHLGRCTREKLLVRFLELKREVT